MAVGSWSPEEENKSQAGTVEGPSKTGCNGCCTSEEAARRSSSSSQQLGGEASGCWVWKCCKLWCALGLGWLALLWALGEEEEEAERGEGAPQGGCWPPTPFSSSLLSCCLLAASCWLGWDRLRTAALLLAACCGGEALAQLGWAPGEDRLLSWVATGVVLSCLAGGAWLGLGLPQGVLLVAFTSALRCAWLLWLERLPGPWGAHLAHLLGLLGIVLAGCAHRSRSCCAPGRHQGEDVEDDDRGEAARSAAAAAAAAASPAPRAEVPVLKRRRRSSSMICAEMAGCGSKTPRRTSLPCIPREQESS